MDSQSSLLNLMKRVNLSNEIQDDLRKILPSDSSDLLLKLGPKTLSTLTCPETKKKFICCEFNEYQNSYRSPYSNQYVPLINAPIPSKTLRDIELKALTLFEDFANSYFKNGTSSVYIKETSDRSYAMCFCIQKKAKNGETNILHIIDLLYDGHNKIIFKLFTKFLFISKDKDQDFVFSTVKTIEEPVNRQDVSLKEIDYTIKMIENLGGILKRNCQNFIQSKPAQIIQACRFVPAQQERTRDHQLIKAVWDDKNLQEQEKLRNPVSS